MLDNNYEEVVLAENKTNIEKELYITPITKEEILGLRQEDLGILNSIIVLYEDSEAKLIKFGHSALGISRKSIYGSEEMGRLAEYLYDYPLFAIGKNVEFKDLGDKVVYFLAGDASLLKQSDNTKNGPVSKITISGDGTVLKYVSCTDPNYDLKAAIDFHGPINNKKEKELKFERI